MIVSLVKESRKNEKRALLLPKEVYELSQICDFHVEESTGFGLDLSDEDYQKAGAKIVDHLSAWSCSDLILKLKCPSIDEIMEIQDKKSIAALFHAEVAPEIIDILIQKEITAYSFEYFKDENGNYPLMRATGELSGQQAIIYAAYHLQSHLSGSGRSLMSCSTMSGATVAVLGFGNVGQAATKLALNLGAKVILFRWSGDSICQIKFNGHVIECYPWNQVYLNKIVPNCDVVIGAIRISTFDTPIFLGKEIIYKMRPGSVIVDVTAGYGHGYIETSDETTTLNNPYHIVNGIKHIKIRELPLGIHQTAANQISSIYMPYIKHLIQSLQNGKTDPISSNGVITMNGRITNPQVFRHYEKRYKG